MVGAGLPEGTEAGRSIRRIGCHRERVYDRDPGHFRLLSRRGRGPIAAAAQEEHFTRKKHDADFLGHAHRLLPAGSKADAEQLDYVGFYDKPLLTSIACWRPISPTPRLGSRLFLRAMPLWLNQKLHLPREIGRGLHGRYRKKYVFTQHHIVHTASAFYPPPYDEAAILTIDGVGEWATGSFGVGCGDRIELSNELHFPHSLGLLYSAFTYFTGFAVNSDEYKLMGLAPYGEPEYVDLILENLLDLKPDGSFEAIWVQPAAGDAGRALGVAQYIWYQLLDNPRRAEAGDSQQGSLLGVHYSDRQIEQFLRSVDAVYERVDDDEALCEQVAEATSPRAR